MSGTALAPVERTADSIADARRDLALALDGVELPDFVETPYGEAVYVQRYVRWFEHTLDQPTMHVLAALLRAAYDQGRGDAG